MTHEEKLQLAEISGVLNFARWWTKTQLELGKEYAGTEADEFVKGFGTGEVRVASDVIPALDKAIAKLEPLWKGPRNA